MKRGWCAFLIVLMVTKPSSRRAWIGSSLLAALAAWLFWSALGFDFVRWDDDVSVTQNPMMKEAWSWELAARFFDADTAMRFKPLHWLLLRALYGWFGLDPVAWHAVGWGLHAIAAMLLFLVLRKELRCFRPEADDATLDWAAWFGSALWAVHPLRVEPVAWVTGSTYPVTAVFLLGSFLSYLKAHEQGGRKVWLVAAWVGAVAAYATYPVSVAYGLWLLAADAGLLRTAGRSSVRNTWRWWGKHGLFLGPAVLAVGFTLWSRLHAPGIFNRAPSFDLVTWDERVLAALASLAKFPVKFLWPADLTPNQPPLPQSAWVNGWMPAYALITVVVAGLLYRIRKTHPVFTWFCLGFVGLSLPCLGLTERPVWPVDRYSYLLDMVLTGGLAGCALGAILSCKRHRRPATAFVIVAALLWSAVLARTTSRILPAWRNTDALFTHMERHQDFSNNPVQQAHIYKLWGYHLAAENQRDEAARKLNRAGEVYMFAIRTALAGGDYAKAVMLALRMEANLGITPVLRRERGGWLLKLGRVQEARDDLRAAFVALPEDARTQELLAGLETIPAKSVP